MKRKILMLVVTITTFLSCQKESKTYSEPLSKEVINEAYKQIGIHHNASLSNILLNLKAANTNRNIKNEMSLSEDKLYDQIVDNSYQYLVDNNLVGDVSQSEYYSRIYTDIIGSFVNETVLDISDINQTVRTYCGQLKTQFEAADFHSTSDIDLFVDNYFNSHINNLTSETDIISFVAFASTLKSSAKFWFEYEESPTTSGMHTLGKPNWKAIAFWDGVGALKGAWEFGKLGFLIGGGAGAFVVGATGAIFEGAGASSAAYLEGRIESFLGL